MGSSSSVERIAEVIAPVPVFVVRQIQHQVAVENEDKTLRELLERTGCSFPGHDYHPPDPKNWMSGLNPKKLNLNQIVWPGTHNSGTNEIGIPLITRPYAECQSLSIYQQLVLGTRLLDIRVDENKEVRHGIVTAYHIDVVLNDVKEFIQETKSEIIILEIRTEYGYKGPPKFDKYLEQHLGEYLIHQDDQVFQKTVAEILPKRIICFWKPQKPDPPKVGGPFWSSSYLKDDWINTDLPNTKFESNLNCLSQQQPVNSRKYFYRVENTVTPQASKIVGHVRPVTYRIHGYARLFITQCFSRSIADRLQVFSTDFIDESFVSACVGLTWSRVEERSYIIRC